MATKPMIYTDGFIGYFSLSGLYTFQLLAVSSLSATKEICYILCVAYR